MGNHRHLSTSFVVNGEVRLPHCAAFPAVDDPSNRSIDRFRPFRDRRRSEKIDCYEELLMSIWKVVKYFGNFVVEIRFSCRILRHE